MGWTGRSAGLNERPASPIAVEVTNRAVLPGDRAIGAIVTDTPQLHLVEITL
jgi:hypothetical protein